MKANISHKLAWGVAVLLTSLILAACMSNRVASTPPLELPPVSSQVMSIFALTDQINLNPEIDDLIKTFQEDIKRDPKNIRGYILIAQYYSIKGNYRLVYANLENAFILDPSLSDTHYGFGNLYYDLAIVDIVVGQKYVQESDGNLTLKPDEISRELFKRALDELNIGKSLESKGHSLAYTDSNGNRIVFYTPDKIDIRITQASLYVGDIPSETLFAEDQAKAAMWMMNLDSRFPDRGYQEIAEGLFKSWGQMYNVSFAKDRYLKFAEGVKRGNDTFGKKIFQMIDASSHPQKHVMGLTLEYYTLIAYLKSACMLDLKEYISLFSQELQNNLDAMQGPLIGESQKLTVPKSPCDENAMAKLDQQVYDYLQKQEQSLGDVFLITEYGFYVDQAFILIKTDNTLDNASCKPVIKVIDNLKTKMELSEGQAKLLQYHRELFSSAAIGVPLPNSEDVRALFSAWFESVMADRLVVQP